MSNGGITVNSQQLQAQVDALSRVAQTSADPCIIAQSLALNDQTTFGIFLGKLQAGFLYRGAFCVPRRDSYIGVVFDFAVDAQVSPHVFSLLQPWFAVVVDLEFARIVGVQDPYIPAPAPTPKASGCDCDCNESSPVNAPEVKARPQDGCPPGCTPYQDNCCTWYYDENGFKICTSSCTRCDCLQARYSQMPPSRPDPTTAQMTGRRRSQPLRKLCTPWFGFDGDTRGCYRWRRCCVPGTSDCHEEDQVHCSDSGCYRPPGWGCF